MRKFGTGFIWLCIVGAALLLGVLAAADLFFYAHRPVARQQGSTLFTVSPGQGLADISRNLAAGGYIEHPVRFRILARILGWDKKIKAGEYVPPPESSPLAILDQLVTGKVKQHRVTIPEGYALDQIADLLDGRGLVARDAFATAAHDSRLLAYHRLAADSFEGYLFPDTYYFTKPVRAEKVIETMLERFRQVFTPAMQKRARALDMTVHQVVTLASMIEKETGAPFERPLISSVFHNRLKKKMRLASDPTVIYGLDAFDGNLTKEHLKTWTPYNTYRIRGLPPGPIANPGLASLTAALYPADTGYLYFVAKKDRTHYFSKNLKEHNRAVRKYQLRR